jgi:two-component system response regulator NreC
MERATPCGSGERSRIRVLIVDDHPVLRAGIASILDGADCIETVAQAADLESAARSVRSLRPDVVLLDTLLDGRWTLPAVRTLTTTSHRTAVIALSDQPYDARSAFAAGASGYVLKESAPATLIDAVREVARGRRYLDPRLGAQLITEEAVPSGGKEALAGREPEVVRLLALGYTCPEIAAALGKSVRTVEVWRARIMEKLGFSSRSELVRYALSHGMLDAPPGEPRRSNDRRPVAQR